MASVRGRGNRAAALVLAVGSLALSGCGGGDPPAAGKLPACPEADGALPGMQAGEAPWPPELRNLGERLDELGLPRLTQEGQALDTHVQLSVEVEGTPVRVPAFVGLNGEEVAGGRMVSGFVSAIHTHDGTGLVHVHSPDVRPYTLGQVFDVWGVMLTADRVGGYCAGGGRSLTVRANGEDVTGDPRDLALEDQLEVSVVYGGE